MAIISVNQPKEPEKKEKYDPWVDILRGLQVAQSVAGIATSAQQYGIQKLQKERLGREEEYAKETLRGIKKLEEENILTPAMEKDVFIVPKDINVLGETPKIKGSREAISEKTGETISYIPKQEAEFYLKQFASEQDSIRKQLEGLTAKDKSELEMNTIKEISGHKETLNLNTRIGYFNAIKEGLARGDAIGDRQAIIAYLKLIEPTSAVLPGEFEGMAKARGVADRLMGLVDTISAGNTLDEKMRSSILTLSGKMLNDSINNYYGVVVTPFVNYGKSKGLNTDLFVNPSYKDFFYSTKTSLPQVNAAIKVLSPQNQPGQATIPNAPTDEELKKIDNITSKIR